MREGRLDGIGALVRVRRESPSGLLSTRRWQSANPKTTLTRARLYWHPDLGLPVSRTVRNKEILLFTSHTGDGILLLLPSWIETLGQT